jgi:sorbose reductase
MSITLSESLAQPRPALPTPQHPASVFAQLRLTDRVAIITGAADGIGLAVASAYAEAGCHLALWYNSNSACVTRGEELAKEFGVKVKCWQVRVQDSEAVRKGMEDVVAEFGRVDVFVANAGMGNSKGLLEMSVQEYRELMGVNVDGVVWCAKYVGEVFKRQGKGVLIITSSISAHIVNVPVDQPVYNMGKAAVSHLGKSLAREWRGFARVVSSDTSSFLCCCGVG